MDLHDAARDGDCERLERLLRSGCPVDQFDHAAMTPLVYAAQSPQASVDVLQLLLDAGAKPNRAIANDGKHAIGLAASSGSISKVQLLLDAGADIHYASKGRYTIGRVNKGVAPYLVSHPIHRALYAHQVHDEQK